MSSGEYGDQEKAFLNIYATPDQLELEVGFYMEAYSYSPSPDEAREIAATLVSWADARAGSP